MKTHSECWHPLQNENSFLGAKFLNLGSNNFLGHKTEQSEDLCDVLLKSAVVPQLVVWDSYL